MKQMKVSTMQVALRCHRCRAETREKARIRVGDTARHTAAPLCRTCQERVPNVRIVRLA